MVVFLLNFDYNCSVSSYIVLESFLESMVLYLCVIKTFLLSAIISINFHGFSIVNSVNEVVINFLDCNMS